MQSRDLIAGQGIKFKIPALPVQELSKKRPAPNLFQIIEKQAGNRSTGRS
jgi:hypothetical protein